MKKCLVCENEYKNDINFCPTDNVQLIDSQAATLLGRVIDERYRLEKLVGVGGMGFVFRARHLQMDVDVAIKVLNPELISKASIIERFRREARAAITINHPNAIKVMDFGIFDSNICYLVMEFLDGESLKEIIHRESILSLETTVRIVDKICQALSEAHSKNILHRDIKPDNILILKYNTPQEVVKVLDFSIAKLLTDEGEDNSQLTKTGSIIGTPAYMSPEQAQALEVDGRTDIYSLGICVYEALTGKPPFKSSSSMALVAKHIHALPRSLREVNEAIPVSVEAVVMKAIAKRPEHRFSTVDEFFKAFLDAIEHSKSEPQPAITEPTNLQKKANHLVSGDSTHFDVERSGTLVDGPVVDTSETGKKHDQSKAGYAAKTRKNIVLPTSYPVNPTPADPLEPAPSNGSAYLEPSISPDRSGTADRSNKPESAIVSAGSVNTGNHGKARLPKLLGLLVVSLVVLGAGGYLASVYFKGGFSKAGEEPQLKKMQLIPAGNFAMGRNPGEGVEDDETPAHEVNVAGFWLSTYEVTNQEYQEFIKAENYAAPPKWSGTSFPPGTEDYPVTNVSWTDANNYCKWLTKNSKNGRVYRLPSEVEWEYAARSADNRLYPWGNNFETFRTVLGDQQSSGSPVPVHSNQLMNDVSPYKIIGLAGNVTEWTDTTYYLYPGSRAKYNNSSANCKILRGGNYLSEVAGATATYRPSWYTPDFKDERIGFRVAADVKPEDKADNQTK